MRALASSLSSWKLLERQEGTARVHGLTFPLAVVAAIGEGHGLELVAEEALQDRSADGFDAVFIGVLDSRCMVSTAEHFAAWGIALDSRDRGPRDPIVWAGGQGLANPRPYDLVADLIVIGDAEEPLPELLALWERSSTKRSFLDAASSVKSVYVPSVHDPSKDRIELAVSKDIGVTIRRHISVSHDRTRRIEIARGCRFKCAFCSLGWRSPVRENSAGDIDEQLAASPRRVHLQAGDAESHSEIELIRNSLERHGALDQGWTGRLDSRVKRNGSTPGSKRYAFGVEGVSYRLRRAVGKSYLTNDRLEADTIEFFATLPPDTVGRSAWHMIAGLPTERPDEVLELARVLSGIRKRWRGRPKRLLSLHWQPFQPLPWTPAQWSACGGGARSMITMLRSSEQDNYVPIRQLAGRTDAMAKICTVLSRSAGEPALRLLRSLGGPLTPSTAVSVGHAGYGDIELDAALPWDFIDGAYTKAQLRRAADVMSERLRRTR